ncbi:hypothetical protein FQB35_11340 [Crassaminicella thermophila]|uniref:Uncharacterized protein n=1 Tax=Crassaminicella thermophila TaxID=2599308 RepID=A0A5C0SEV8_CRATE|nr:hypothetical protein [Crassaminicella thermophila]QEK12871.1 hypothetical protein FQB35_11340 [Crassaminicella thermophila]
MDHKNVAVGIFIFFTFVMLGGVFGIFVGYSLSDSIKIQNHSDIKENVENNILKEQKIEKEILPINISKLDNLKKALDTWKEIIQRTSQGKLDKKEAAKLIYEMSSNIYKRNIPEEFFVYRLKNIIGNGQLKELNYSNITYDDEDTAYIDVVEIYEEGTCCYKLKFIKENKNWCFAAQL